MATRASGAGGIGQGASAGRLAAGGATGVAAGGTGMLWQFACRRKTSRSGAMGAPLRRSVRGLVCPGPVDAFDLKNEYSHMSTERRWNGWGDASVHEALKPEALAFLAQAIGAGQAPSDATFAAARAQVEAQPSRLAPHPLIDTRAETPLRASFGLSTLGGWVVTRSSGQQSARYGRIEQLFAGGTLQTPEREWTLPTFPASAAGPDLREWVLGSEGRIGVLTEASVRVTRAPAAERFVGVFFPDWASAAAAVRRIAQARLGLSMLRLANPAETFTTLQMAGHASAIGWLERWLSLC